MADLSQPVKTALGRYWSEILAGASQHLSTQDLYNNIRNRATQLGLPTVGVGAQAISTLRGYAGRMQAAANAFNKAGDTDALVASHISQTPWSRSLNEQSLAPVVNVSILHTIEQDDGSTVKRHQTIVIQGALPDTVGQLRQFLEEEAALLAAEGGPADSGTPHGKSLGITDISIMAV